MVNDNYPGSAMSGMADDVAGVVSTVSARYGLEETRELKKYYGQPCTMDRACMWNPEGKPWLAPWVYVLQTSDGRVHVVIEMRDAWHNGQVKKITQEVANELRARFGSERVSVGIGY